MSAPFKAGDRVCLGEGIWWTISASSARALNRRPTTRPRLEPLPLVTTPVRKLDETIFGKGINDV